MSFKANLYVGDSKYKVLTCEYELSQAVDHKNKPKARPKGGLINVVVESNKKEPSKDRLLFDWMASETQIKNGYINFLKPTTEATLKRLEFTNAYCINYKETFAGQGSSTVRIELIISAEKMSLGGSSEHENTWSIGSNGSQ